jgi:hypothetical protein
METWQALNVRPATGEGLISIVRFEPDDGWDRPPQMHNTFSGILGLIVPLFSCRHNCDSRTVDKNG